MQKLIVIIGVKGSGKDHRSKNYEGTKIGFSDSVREAAFDLVGITPENDEEYELFKKHIFETYTGISMTGRQILEHVGEGYKKGDPDIWADKWKIKALSTKGNIIAHDCRFDNELKSCLVVGEKLGMDIKFIFADYRSDRYDDESVSGVNALALHIRSLGYKDGDDITDYIVNHYSQKFFA